MAKTKYIYHCENTKTTCTECKKYDGKIFFNIKDIPNLPIHPNCRCWIEIIDYKNDDSICNCGEIINILKTGFCNISKNCIFLTNIIDEEKINFKLNMENIVNTKLYSNAYINKEIQSIENILYERENEIKDLKKQCEDKLTDILWFEESALDPTYHTKEECKIYSDLANLIKLFNILNTMLNQAIAALNKTKETISKFFKDISDKNDKTKQENTFLQGQVKKYSLKSETNTSEKDTSHAEKQSKIYQIAYMLLSPLIGKHYNKLAYVLAKKAVGDDAAGFLDLAHGKDKMNKPGYLANVIELTGVNDKRIVADKEYLTKKINSQIDDEYAKIININDFKGYFFQHNSSISMNIAEDENFLEIISKNKDNILKGKTISMQFPDSDKNLHNSLGHVDIRNGYIDKEGNLRIEVYDTYEFNKANVATANIIGRKEMLKGTLKPFFSVCDIIIPKNVLDTLWR